MVFWPPRLAPVILGLAVLTLLLGLAGLGFFFVAGALSITISTFFLGLWVFLLLLLAAITAWRVYSCLTMHYRLTRDALTICWAYRKVIVPIADIREVVSAGGKPVRWVRGLHWFAYHIASGTVEALGLTHFYATHLSPRNLVYVVADEVSYGISLANPQRFVRYLDTCRRLGTVSTQARRVEDRGLVCLPVWQDRWVMALSLSALAVNLGLFAYLSLRYASIPSFLPVHFGPDGQVDRIGEKFELFRLPVVALLILAGNGLAGLHLHLKESYMARMVLALGFLVQFIFWVAALQLTT